MSLKANSKIWNVEDMFGPVIEYGIKSWYVCFCQDGIVLLPMNFLCAAQGLLGGIIYESQMKKIRSNFFQSWNCNSLNDQGNPKWKRYNFNDFDQIQVKFCKYSCNEIRIKRNGCKDKVFGIVNREDTQEIRKSLAYIYNDKYVEENFK